MAINRAPFNALTDDTGDNLTGSMWNKAAIQSVLLDPIDALVSPGVKPTYIASNATGVQNAWAPGIGDDTFILWNGGADLTLNGMAGNVVGRRVTIRNAGSGNIFVTNYSAAAASGQKFNNPVTSGPTPIASAGYATWINDGNFGWILVAHEQGAWITPPFSAANFTGNLGAWTVDASDVVTLAYCIRGRQLWLNFQLQSTSLPTQSNYLNLNATPYLSTKEMITPCYFLDAGTPGFGYVLAHPGQNAVAVTKAGNALFATSTNNTSVYGIVPGIEIQ